MAGTKCICEKEREEEETERNRRGEEKEEKKRRGGREGGKEGGSHGGREGEREGEDKRTRESTGSIGPIAIVVIVDKVNHSPFKIDEDDIITSIAKLT